MTPEDFRAQLEHELDWRQKELRVYANQLSSIHEEDKRIYCKALIVMLYSHFEGFSRMAFLTYLKLINDEKIARSLAKENITASSLLDVFHDLQYPDKSNEKCCCELFKSPSMETKFSKFFIYTHFIRKLDEIFEKEVYISEDMSDRIVDAESNLTPRVIRKILYRLGLPYDAFDQYEGIICRLLIRRNNYAHGDNAEGINEVDYHNLERDVNIMISDLMVLLTEAARTKSYLRV